MRTLYCIVAFLRISLGHSWPSEDPTAMSIQLTHQVFKASRTPQVPGRGRPRHVGARSAQSQTQSQTRAETGASCVVPSFPCSTHRELLFSGDKKFHPASTVADDSSVLEQALVRTHSSALTAVAWLNDSTVLTAGMDKTVCFVNVNESGDLSVAKRIILSGGPAHSILPSSSGIIMGLHNKSLLELVSPPSSAFLQDMQYSVLEANLCGWPRDLASNGMSLFSSSCNEIRQFDTATKKGRTYRLDKGDILSLACTRDQLFAGTVDGSLFGFSIDPKSGSLELRSARPKAHAGRVSDLLIHRGMLFSSSYDGTIKSWCLDGLEIVGMAAAAKNGARVLALAQEDWLYTGGSDGTIRVFDPIVLEERKVIVPPGLEEDEGIRALAVNGSRVVVGTSAGKLILVDV